MREYLAFDVQALWEALQSKRESMGLSESEMMEDLNRVNNNAVPIALATVNNMARRGDTTCQHSLHMLRWLDKTPESFLVGAITDESLPYSDQGRLYWSMSALGRVAQAKDNQGLSWQQIADELDSTQSRVSGIHRLRYGMSVHLAMRITQWLGRPSSDFIVVID